MPHTIVPQKLLSQSAWKLAPAGLVLAILVSTGDARPPRRGGNAPRSNGQAPPATAAPSAGASTETVAAVNDKDMQRAIDFTRDSREAMANIKDYTAVFTKREVVGNRLTTQVMDMKFRQEPFSVYFGFRGPEAGREVIYVHGANNGNMLVHDTGINALAGTIALPPTSPQVMKESRYPITRAGCLSMLDAVLKQFEAEARYEGSVVKFYPNAKLGEVPCQVVEVTHPQQARQFRFYRTRLYVDRQTRIPVRVEQYGWPRSPQQQPPIIEEYTYANVRTNVGLTARDFDPRNPNYRF
jgi:hypothetical protein